MSRIRMSLTFCHFVELTLTRQQYLTLVQIQRIFTWQINVSLRDKTCLSSSRKCGKKNILMLVTSNFHLFPQCFTKLSLSDSSYLGVFSKRLTFYHTITTFNTSGKESFWKHHRKGENAGKQHFLLFPQCFQPYQRQKIIILSTLILSSANAFNLE